MQNKVLIFGLIAAGVIGVGCASGGDDDDTAVQGPGAQTPASSSGPTSTTPKAKVHNIVLEVGGAHTAQNITYLVGGDTSQDNGVDLPWKKPITAPKGEVLIMSLSAQNAGAGKITCKITVDGKVVKENASTGEYAVVTCTPDAIM